MNGFIASRRCLAVRPGRLARPARPARPNAAACRFRWQRCRRRCRYTWRSDPSSAWALPFPWSCRRRSSRRCRWRTSSSSCRRRCRSQCQRPECRRRSSC